MANLQLCDAGSTRNRQVSSEEAPLHGSSGGRVEGIAEVTHDARNVVAALGLYCELLEQPGVLSAPFAHYGHELRQVASASQSLVEKLAHIGSPVERDRGVISETVAGNWWPATLLGSGSRDVVRKGWDYQFPAAPVSNLAAELLSMRNLLAALAGPGIAVTVDARGGARPTRITGEDLTRVLVNLVKNAVEAMPVTGRIHVGLREQSGKNGDCLVLTMEDTGPGIPAEMQDRIFASGFSGHALQQSSPRTHRGLGLAITRAIIETAGGKIHAENRLSGGARFVIELPAGR